MANTMTSTIQGSQKHNICNYTDIIEVKIIIIIITIIIIIFIFHLSSLGTFPGMWK
jgi:hypothetical protein